MVIVRQSVFVVPAVSRIAERMGCFARAGLEVVTTTVPSSHAQHADLAEDRVDVAITATDNLFAWGAAGSDIVLIGQIETTTDLALLLRPGLESLDELGAVRLAVDAPANGFAVVAYAMMARLGRVGSADGAGQHEGAPYEVVEVGGVTERFEALAAGAVDATLVAPPLDEIGQQRGISVAMRVQEFGPTRASGSSRAGRSWIPPSNPSRLIWPRWMTPWAGCAAPIPPASPPNLPPRVSARRRCAPCSPPFPGPGPGQRRIRRSRPPAPGDRPGDRGRPGAAGLIDLRPLRIAGLQPQL